MINYAFHIQDPNDPETLYLYEAIVGQLNEGNVTRWSAIFAFATGAAVRTLFVEDDHVSRFIASAQVDIIVGLDAVTDVAALQELSLLARRHPSFTAKVFMDPSIRLFHPKLCRFDRSDGTSALIIGSGNMTSGGLRSNLEAFSIAVGNTAELQAATWDAFLSRYSDSIRDIGPEALQLAYANQRTVRTRPPRTSEAEPEEAIILEHAVPEPLVAPATSDPAVLVAQVPGAGPRWHQVHFNAEVIRSFFQAAPDSSQRLFLQSVSPTGVPGEEEARPIVYSSTNRNYKIEIGYRHGDIYPSDGRPVLVIEKVAARSFRYTMLTPGEAGYSEMLALTLAEHSVGRGVPRVIVPLSRVKALWPAAPF